VKPLALRTSLTLVYTGILALLVTALAFGYQRALATELDAASTALLDEVTRGLHGYLQFRSGIPVLEYDRTDADAVTFIEEATRYYQVYDADDGRLIFQSPALEALGLRYTAEEVAVLASATAMPDVQTVQDIETDRGRLRIQSSIATSPAGRRYLMQVGEPLERNNRALRGFQSLLIWMVAAGLAAAALAGRWMAGRALAPLTAVAGATRAVSINKLDYRLPVRGVDDELDEVTRGFNQALSRLEHAVGEMRQFSAALAHELRTPLAVLRGEAELALTRGLSREALHQTLAGQIDEFDKLARLIEQILTLARAEAGEIVLAADPVDLSALSAAIVEQLEAVAEARDVTLSCTGEPGIVVTGDAGWLERLLIILVDNAVKFTPGGGQISVHVSRDGATATLEVQDTGIGMASSDVSRVFERFYRADPSRSRSTEGAGLGLTLAQWIVVRHNGTIDLKSRPGEGSTFTVRIPAALNDPKRSAA